MRPQPTPEPTAARRPERGIAVVEAVKGLAGLLAALALSAFGEAPPRQVGPLALDGVHRLVGGHFGLLAWAAAGYALLRFVEAFGLWHHRAWGEWIAVLSVGAYLPFEVWGLAHGVTVLESAIFLGNLVILAYVASLLARRRARRKHRGPAAARRGPGVVRAPVGQRAGL